MSTNFGESFRGLENLLQELEDLRAVNKRLIHALETIRLNVKANPNIREFERENIVRTCTQAINAAAKSPDTKG